MDLLLLYQGFIMYISFHSLVATVIFDDDDDDVWGRCPPIRNRLRNGRVKIRSRGRIAKFICDPGYDLAGRRFATCVRGEWNNPIPFCVARGCPRIPTPANSQVTEMYRGSFLTYTCFPGYSLNGVASLYCDGRRWSGLPPTCQPSSSNPKTECDFEEAGLCGWSQDPNHVLDWERSNQATPSGHMGTGPSFDHTLGKGAAGFYLYHEASSPAKVNDSSRLFSPVYFPSYSGGCFNFWYHMYGPGIGSLRLYLKTESEVFDELSPLWEKNGFQPNEWFEGKIQIPIFKENFQIIIEAIRGLSYEGDIAIDDLSLSERECDEIEKSTDDIGNFSFAGSPVSQSDDGYLATATLPLTMVVTSEIEENGTNIEFTIDTTSDSESLNVSFSPDIVPLTTTLPPTMSLTEDIFNNTDASVLYYSTPSTSSFININSPSTMASPSKTFSYAYSTLTTSTKKDVVTKEQFITGTTSITTPITLYATKLVMSSKTLEPTTEPVIPQTASQLPAVLVTSPKTLEPSRSFVSKSTSSVEDEITTAESFTSSVASVAISSTLDPAKSYVSSTQQGFELDSTSTHEQQTTFSSSSTETTRRIYNLRPRTKKTTIDDSDYKTTAYFTSSTSVTTPKLSTLSETVNIFDQSDKFPSTTVKLLSSLPSLFSTPVILVHKEPTSSSVFTTPHFSSQNPSTTKSIPISTKRSSIHLPTYSTNPPNLDIDFQTTAQLISSTDKTLFPLAHDNTATKSASTTSANTSVTVTVVSIIVLSTAGIIGGFIYFKQLQRRKRRSKLSDDSEMRFLAENEIMDYSNPSVLDKILVD